MQHETGKSSNSNACPNIAVQSHSLAVHSITEQTNPGVHVLDHSPENKLTLVQKNERIKYLKEQLKLSETVLNKDEQEKVIAIFLKHFDACSI